MILFFSEVNLTEMQEQAESLQNTAKQKHAPILL